MERKATMTTERKVGREWVEQSFTDDETRIYKQLANVLTAKYQDKARWVSRCAKKCNYDGTYTYTVSYGNGWRDIIRVTF